MRPLTARQTELLTWVLMYCARERRPPTLRELADAFEMSPQGARNALLALEAKGVVRNTGEGARSWTPTSVAEYAEEIAQERRSLAERLNAAVALLTNPLVPVTDALRAEVVALLSEASAALLEAA